MRAVTAYLIRHAHAGNRSDWDQPDTARPLSDKGRRQAEHLASFLADRPIGQVLSSPARRCTETIAPLAQRLDKPVQSSTALFEGADAQGVVTLLDGLGDDEVVLCSHGDLIPEVIRLLRLRGMQLLGDAGNQKGAVWILHHDGERYDKAEYVPPA